MPFSIGPRLLGRALICVFSRAWWLVRSVCGSFRRFLDAVVASPIVATWMRWLGVEVDEVSTKEKAVSGLGGFVAIGILMLITRDALDLHGASMVIASMGASAVLLFAVPHGQLSQPWPVVAGHVTSALIGVTAAEMIGSIELAAAVAVGAAIGAMHVLKCIHPPGGATALTAVVGGPAVYDLGFQFVVRPVLLNAVAMVMLAVAFNAMFAWRRYP
ncbi:MAG: HPP family protein, partial [Ilumatobacter sp.]